MLNGQHHCSRDKVLFLGPTPFWKKCMDLDEAQWVCRFVALGKNCMTWLTDLDHQDNYFPVNSTHGRFVLTPWIQRELQIKSNRTTTGLGRKNKAIYRLLLSWAWETNALLYKREAVWSWNIDKSTTNLKRHMKAQHKEIEVSYMVVVLYNLGCVCITKWYKTKMLRLSVDLNLTK